MRDSRARILFIEDEPVIRDAVTTALTGAGYLVRGQADGMGLRDLADSFPPDLAVLDITLPGPDGLSLARLLRARGDLPILFLTARDGLDDRPAGFAAGADDYLVKPFALEELLARVKALLRRRNSSDITREVLVFEDLELDTATRQARRGNRLIELSTTEYELLAMFLRNSRIVLTRSVLMDRIWGSDFEGGPNVLEVYIGHLRNKLEQGGEKRLIQTVRGAGYVLRTLE